MNSSPLGSRHIPSAFVIALMSVVLASCQSAKQQCDRRYLAQRDALQAQVSELRATLKRGYALHVQEVSTPNLTLCYAFGTPDSPCRLTGRTQIEHPVTVDMAVQRDRLSQLEKALAVAQDRASKGVEACRHRYRE